MDARLRQLVRQRANNYCEYCGLSQDSEPLPFHIEHIIPRQHRRKRFRRKISRWPVITAICIKAQTFPGLIQKTRKLTRLFHPRLDDWDEHFKNRDGEISGLSAIGRTTAALLRMNEDGRLQLRESAEQ